MNPVTPFPIPVRAAPADTQHPDPDLQCLGIPATAVAFQMPTVPCDAAPETLRQAADFLEQFNNELVQQLSVGIDKFTPRLDLMRLEEELRTILNEVLGEGEVSARVEFKQPSPNWRSISVQESVFPGLWRVREFNATGEETANWIETSILPTVLPESALAAAAPMIPDLPMPDGVMNAPSLLSEIRMDLAERQPDTPARVINLTLLPLSPNDYPALLQALPVGPLAIISRSFGSCRVSSTGVQRVWRVQHFNHKDELILNTIVVADCPQVILAAAEDLHDTHERLAELIQWMRDSANDEEAPSSPDCRSSARQY